MSRPRAGDPGKLAERARRHHRRGEFAEAARLCRECLAAHPDHPGALHALALAEARQDRLPEAAALLARVAGLDAGNADLLADLGLVLRRLGRTVEAEEAFRRALAAEPGHPDARHHLGELAREQGDPVTARGHFEAGLRAQPHHLPCLRGLAGLHAESKRPDLAVGLLRRACELDGRNPAVWVELFAQQCAAGLLAEASLSFTRAVDADPRRDDTWRAGLAQAYKSGDKAAGIALCRQWLARRPGHPEPRHMLASLLGEGGAPARAPDDFITELFDRFSAGFDENLTQLQYQAPGLIAGEMRARLPAGPVEAMLDAGCGTGLSGVPLRPLARRLEGVDLSPGMLAKAAARGLYDALHEGELTAWLQSRPAAFDAIACADTLVYFGDWSAVMGAFADALRPGGVLVATTEARDEDPPWRLEASGRYSHSGAGVEAWLAAAGFSDIRLQPVPQLRLEAKRPVRGWLFSAAKTGAGLSSRSDGPQR